MNKKILFLIGLICIIIIMSYFLILINWTNESNQNEIKKTLSIKDLYENPTEYLNKTINITGKIWKIDPYNFHTGIKYFNGQIKREYILNPSENESWSPDNNNHSMSLFIEIYSNNMSFDKYLKLDIILTGYFREFPPEYHYLDSLPDRYYIEVINISLNSSYKN
jgi:hypothetical protein